VKPYLPPIAFSQKTG